MPRLREPLPDVQVWFSGLVVTPASCELPLGWNTENSVVFMVPERGSRSHAVTGTEELPPNKLASHSAPSKTLVAFAELMLVTALLPKCPEEVLELFTRKTMGAAPTGTVTKGTVAVLVLHGSLPVRANFTGVALAVEPLTALLIGVPAQVPTPVNRWLDAYRASSGRMSVNAAVNFALVRAACTFVSRATSTELSSHVVTMLPGAGSGEGKVSEERGADSNARTPTVESTD